MIYPLDFPSQAPATQRLVLNRRQSVSESPWTYHKQTNQTSSQWVLDWTWPPLTFAKAEKIDGWLLSLKGQVGSFRFAPRQLYRYTLSGTTLTTAAFAYNEAISVGGFGANTATGLRVGQYLTIGTQLLRILDANAFADANGAVTITFAPELRLNYAAGTAVNLTAPFGVFSLATSDGLGATLNPNRLFDFGTIQAREVI